MRQRINRTTRIPVYSKPVDTRIKQAKAELFAGLTKAEATWQSIRSQVQAHAGLSLS